MKKIALVTGGNRGIGFESCKHLAQNDIKVILSARDPEKGKQAAIKLNDEQLDVEFVQLDVTNDSSVKNAAHEIRQKYGRCDILVNNAGIYIDRHTDLHELGVKDFERTLQVNLIGAYRTARTFLEMMIENKYGRIINVSSGYGNFASSTQGKKGAYKISKHALNAMTRIMADEVKELDIKINAMDPGWTQTDMGGTSAPRSPELAAETAVWLASLDSNGPSGKFFKDKQEVEW